MAIKYKKITHLGLAAALLGATSLTACGDKPKSDAVKPETHKTSTVHSETGDHGEANSAGEHGEGGESGEAGHAMDMDTLPLPKRLAFMAGHVEAGLSLYRAGEPKMAAEHLLHPISETHAKERVGIDKLGFDGSIFEAVSKALNEGKPASAIEPQLIAAEKNLNMVRAKAGGNPVEIINFLMDTIIEEYTIGVTDGVVTDAGEYQDAWGFARIAKKQAKDMPESVQNDIDALIALWPESPIPPANPASVAKVTALVSKIQLGLPEY